MFIESLPENLHQRHHLEQFWQPGGHEHIFDQSGYVANSVRELQTEGNFNFLDCFVILSRYCNYIVDPPIWNANPDVKPGPPCGKPCEHLGKLRSLHQVPKGS